MKYLLPYIRSDLNFKYSSDFYIAIELNGIYAMSSWTCESSKNKVIKSGNKTVIINTSYYYVNLQPNVIYRNGKENAENMQRLLIRKSTNYILRKIDGNVVNVINFRKMPLEYFDG